MGISKKDQASLVDNVGNFLVNNSWNLHHITNVVVKQAIEEISPVMAKQDICVWTRVDDGIHTVKKMYNFLRFTSPMVAWHSFIWKEFLPPSRSLLCLRAVQNYLPTDDNLCKKGLFFASRCCLCHSSLETAQHLFLQCPFSVVVWQSVSLLFGKHLCLTGSISDFLLDAMSHRFSSQVAALWCSAIVSGLWVIWSCRNDVIFNDSVPDIHVVLRGVWNAIKEVAFFKIGHMYNSIDELRLLRVLHIPGIPRRAPWIISVYWQSPPVSWIKINTDGSALGSPGEARAGGIFRTSCGYARGSFAFRIGCSFAYLAELQAAIYAVNMAWDRGWHQLWLECDSSYVVGLFQSKSHHVPWTVKPMWLHCLHLVSNMHFRVSHIFREGNVAADLLAKHGVSASTKLWWETAPDFCLYAIYSDFSGRSNYRFN